MSKEMLNTIKQESVKLIPKGVLSIILFGGVSYGYVNTLTVFPASTESSYSTKKTNFIQASLAEASHYVSDLPQCHIFEIASDLGTCHNMEATEWLGEYYCFYPLFPGKCNS